MSGLTGLINRALTGTPGWESSSMLPIQRRTGPAPAPVEGTDESGRKQMFTQPSLALGIPEGVKAPVRSLINSAEAVERGEAPATGDILSVLMTGALPSLGVKASDEAMMSAGARASKDLPRTFYRGANPGDTRRILTGDTNWDSHLFASSNPDSAKNYGSQIIKLEAAPDAKILYEGTKDFVNVAGKWRKGENMLEYASRAAQAAKAAGYDAIHFHRQGDIGTAIFNPNKFIPDGLINRPNITPASIAGEHALDMAANDRLAAEAAAKNKLPEKP